MNVLADIIGDYRTFLAKTLQEMVDAGFDLADFVQLDHLCYVPESTEDHAVKKKQLQQVGTLLDEVMVSKRPIASFRLHEPIRHDTWRIDAVELAALKPGQDGPTGLRHLEFVLYDDKHDFLKKHAGKTFELKAVDRGINPEIAYTLPSSIVVKFHLLNLPTAVYLQKKLGITEL